MARFKRRPGTARRELRCVCGYTTRLVSVSTCLRRWDDHTALFQTTPCSKEVAFDSSNPNETLTAKLPERSAVPGLTLQKNNSPVEVAPKARSRVGGVS